ncbi:hypothetical protein FRUB_07198 [Fimbriiglobus ruber]|uniref:Uncharacterized protein n=1 Tax=Fimbriiglobus ruber TaxID=1908690 RepID=A0A225DHR6_9BACT|nr:hypothetical protein FRUB_07198 [Fimbriiglobus ruber]
MHRSPLVTPVLREGESYGPLPTPIYSILRLAHGIPHDFAVLLSVR